MSKIEQEFLNNVFNYPSVSKDRCFSFERRRKNVNTLHLKEMFLVFKVLTVNTFKKGEEKPRVVWRIFSIRLQKKA